MADESSNDELNSRPSVPALDAVLGTQFPVLDHGFVRVIDYMGDDAAVVQAARVSYGKGTKSQREDAALIRYLMQHRHTSPFEMCEIKLHVKLPIFVARQWIRHRTASVNEYSARYSILDKEFYIPDKGNLAPQARTNKQGRTGVLGDEEAEYVLNLIRSESNNAYENYLDLLNEEKEGAAVVTQRQGLSRELARMCLGVNYYTQWYWKVNLHNLMNFLRLRVDEHAQYEIRVYAERILDISRRWVPQTMLAFEEYQLNSLQLSSSALKIVKAALRGEDISFEKSGMSRREWDEIQEKLFK